MEFQGPHKTYNAKEQWDILQKYVGWYKNSSAQIRVFHNLQMKHPECEGTQIVRCYPFETHPFRGRTIKDPVMMLPLRPSDDFSLPEDQESLEYGRVMLFFSCLLPGHLGKLFEYDLAFIKYFDIYNIKGMSLVMLLCVYVCDVFLLCVGTQRRRVMGCRIYPSLGCIPAPTHSMPM